MPDFTEPFHGCRICSDPSNHGGRAHSAAIGCECTREVRDPKCTAERFWAQNIIAEAWREDRDPLAGLDDRSAAHVSAQLLEGIRQLAGAPVDDPTQSNIERELCAVLNRYSAEAPSGTPDFILASYLLDCLRAFNEAVSARGQWRGEPVEFTPSAAGFPRSE